MSVPALSLFALQVNHRWLMYFLTTEGCMDNCTLWISYFIYSYTMHYWETAEHPTTTEKTSQYSAAASTLSQLWQRREFNYQPSTLLHCTEHTRSERRRYLFVHEDVDDWVVDSGCLGKEGGDGRQPGIEFNGWMSCDQYGEDCVRRPAHHECNYHDHHHTGHLPLWLPGGGQTTMRHLEETGNCN